MTTIVGIVIMIASFWLMEVVAWTAHKYIMHGPFWTIHEDHHVMTGKFFQRNDWFFLIFAIPSWLFMMFGIMAGCDWRMWVGIGIAVYGVAYTFVHEILIHQRINFFKRTKFIYFIALRKAHRAHHKHLTKDDGECFGMLVVPQKYFEAARKEKTLFDNA